MLILKSLWTERGLDGVSVRLNALMFLPERADHRTL